MPHIGLPAHSITIESKARKIQNVEALEPALSDFKVAHVSGFAATPHFNLDSNFDEPLGMTIALSDVSPAIGEWTAVAVSPASSGSPNSSYIVCNDEYGYSPIFYAQIPGTGIVVSDSFQGVSYELMRNGVQATLNLDSYATTVLTKDSRLSNPLAWQTSASEIFLLPPHYALHVSESAISVFNRAELLDFSGESFGSIISSGIEYITQTLSNLASHEQMARSLLLSGGVDSRVVLALVLAAGEEKSYSIRSNDPRLYKNKYSYRVFEDDFFISHAIGNHFGMNWHPTRSAHNVRTSLEEGLRISQSTSSNFSNAFPATTHHPVYVTPEISLRGGGGEPIKGAGFLSLIKQVQENSTRIGATEQSPFEQFKQWYLQNAIVDQSKSNFIESSFDEIRPLLNTDSFDTMMPSYYQHSRNRTHFGHGKFSSGTNLFPFQPLSNSHFFSAARQRENTDLRANAIARRVFELTEPSLLDFPFEDTEATKQLTNGHVREIQKNADTLDAHFRLLAEQKPTFQELTFPGSSNDKALSNKNAALISMCRSIANDIEEAFSSKRKELKSLHKSVFDALELGVLSPALTVARMMSARDTFMPSSQPGSNITYSSISNTSATIKIRGLSSNDILPSLKSTALSHRPPVVLSPKTSVKDKKILVEANPESTRPAQLEFAFYLLVNGRVSERSTYSNNSSLSFDFPDGAQRSTITIKCFARHEGTIAPCVIMTARI